jgi:diacylglycerol kinase (ATP)
MSLVSAIKFSLVGLRDAYSSERAFRQETWLACVLVPAACWLGESWVEIGVLQLAVLLVLVVELLNTSIETVVNRVSFERNDLSRRAKDIAAAAVFVTTVCCASLWISALGHKLYRNLF